MHLLSVAARAALFNQPAEAQSWPQLPVKIIVPPARRDIMARLIVDRIAPLWGQSVVVENRPGGLRARRRHVVHGRFRMTTHCCGADIVVHASSWRLESLT